MLQVIGPWGAGTSLVCAILDDCGCWFGRSIESDPSTVSFGRNKHGLYEHHMVHMAHEMLQGPHARYAEDATLSGFADIILGAEERGLVPAVKLPGIIIAPQLWHLWLAAGDRVVWVERWSKDYGQDTVWQELKLQGEEDYVRRMLDELRSRYTTERQYRLDYNELLADPERVVLEMCEAVELDYNPASIARVDPSWPVNRLASALSDPSSVT